MNKISTAFENKKAFIGFITAGDPTFEVSLENIMAMVNGGADLIEIGIPFSDPIAEGTVVQDANIRALNNGMTTDRAFRLVEKVREKTDIPICFKTYLNPVFKYGYDRFFKRCNEVGVDGLICPDMPFEEKAEADDIAKKYGISIISLLSPTNEERLKTIVQHSEGYIYVVSSTSGNKVDPDIIKTIESIRKYTNLPAIIGFGVNTPAQAAEIAKLSDGAFSGSAVVELAAQYGNDAHNHIFEYVKSVKSAL